jgi:glycerophosphoryl diester phosphodiesterase
MNSQNVLARFCRHAAQRRLRLFLLAAGLLTLAAWPAAAGEAPTAANPRKIIVIAHRGIHTDAPENTLASIQKSIAAGCDYVELDIRRTRDGALVLMHDSSVDRTTNGRGKVEAMALAEIQKLDAGVKRGTKWAGQKVPTFDEALAACKGKIKVYVDHKAGPPAEIFAAIEKHGMVDDVVIYGSVQNLREFKRINSRVWIMPDHPGSPEKIKALVKDLKPETLDGNIVKWTVEQVQAAHEAGAQVWVDNPEQLDNEPGVRRAVEMGVDAIQSDAPEKVTAILKTMGRR